MSERYINNPVGPENAGKQSSSQLLLRAEALIDEKIWRRLKRTAIQSCQPSRKTSMLSF